MKTLKLMVLVMVMLIVMCGCKKEDKSKEVNTEVEINESVGDDAQVTTEEPSVSPSATNTEQPQATKKATKAPTKTVSLIEARNASNYTVVIDAGHQRKGMNDKEPIGPGATETKPKVSSGTTGVASGVAEYIVTLQVSKKIESLLKSKGYNVIMCRDTHDVTMSNSERAQIANNANADAFVRIHCNGATSASAKGALTMCQTKKNPYVAQYYSKSRNLSQKVVDRLCEATGANNKGILESDTMSGINWCNVPVTIVEMGFMSNREEDLLLVDDGYQDKLAVGISNGVIEYLNAQ